MRGLRVETCRAGDTPHAPVAGEDDLISTHRPFPCFLCFLCLVAGASSCGHERANRPSVSYGPPLTVRTKAVDKVDLLFMVDNSPGMADKQALLVQSVPRLLDRLLQPGSGFPPVHDMHIGIVTSSLGGRGADACGPTIQPFPYNTHFDDQGHLINRGGANESAMADANPSGYLAWLPPVESNAGAPTPPVPPIGDPGQLLADLQEMISGVHEHGCIFGGQNEAWYRFLVQPDPFEQIEKDALIAQLQGVDATIIQQRHDFLRPDSLLAIVVVTDHDEGLADPLSIRAQGWVFANTAFPGSPNGTAPRGTIECTQQDPNDPAATGPNDPNCTSCAFLNDDQDFGQCPGGVYLAAADDSLLLRFFHPKERFGVSADYPTARYVLGLTNPLVPSVGLAFSADRDHEHDTAGDYVGALPAHQNCVNPIYATGLPTDPTADLCHLTRGPRSPDMVLYDAIAGVPHQLLQADPSNPDSGQKPALAAADWLAITGPDPERYDFRGADFHMLESWSDRAGSTCPSATARDDCDPIVGREWDTGRSDLEFACIFDLPAARDCSQLSPDYPSCDCVVNSVTRDTPLCLRNPGDPMADAAGYTQTQTRARAKPSLREMVVAHSLGDQGVASSICPIHVIEGTPGDPLFAYRPAMDALADRMAPLLAPPCLAQPLPLEADGTASCVMLATLPDPGDESACAHVAGLAPPAPDLLASYRAVLEQQWRAAGGSLSGAPDPSTLPVCEVTQLAPGCGGSKTAGWCYESPGTGACAQSIVFAGASGAPSGASVSIECPQ